jgi:perosamine synthetase
MATLTAQRSIPFGKPILGQAEEQAVLDVLRGTTLTHGPRVEQFEVEFTTFVNGAESVATNSCTAALHIAYLYAGLEPGDEVIVPAQTHTATAHAVELCGARPVFVDVEADTGNLDLRQVQAAITSRTKVLAVVHFLGLPVDMDAVQEIAERHHLFVVEDCALSLGATWRGTHTGLLGDVGCFSFYPAKHITTAEGGMLITRRLELADAARRLRAFGIDRNIVNRRPVPGRYDVIELGNNYRMNEMSAALGIQQLNRLPEFLDRRALNRDQLRSGLGEIPGVRLLSNTAEHAVSSNYCEIMLLDEHTSEQRDTLILRLRERGIGTSVYYPRPVPLMTYYQEKYAVQPETFPQASRISNHSIALPIGPHLDQDDIAYIVDSVRAELAEGL